MNQFSMNMNNNNWGGNQIQIQQQRPHPTFDFSKKKKCTTMTWDTGNNAYNYEIVFLDVIIDSTNEYVPTFRYKVSNKLNSKQSKAMRKKSMKPKLEDKICNIEYVFENVGGMCVLIYIAFTLKI